MPALQVRDFPETLYQQLKDSAAREHRSLAQQTVALVERGLAGEGMAPKAKEGSAPGVIAPVVQTASPARDYRPRFDDPEKRAERIAKRKALFERCAKHESSPVLSSQQIVSLVREGREERADRVLQVLANPDLMMVGGEQ